MWLRLIRMRRAKWAQMYCVVVMHASSKTGTPPVKTNTMRQSLMCFTLNGNCNCRPNCIWDTCIAPPLLEDRGRITESVRILVAVDRMKQNVFRSRRNNSVDRSSFSSVGSLFHARSAATERALLPVRRRVRGMTRLPHNEARSVDRPGILVTNVRRSEIYSGVRPRGEPASTACTGSSQRLESQVISYLALASVRDASVYDLWKTRVKCSRFIPANNHLSVLPMILTVANRQIPALYLRKLINVSGWASIPSSCQALNSNMVPGRRYCHASYFVQQT